MTREEASKIFRKEIECMSHSKCEDCILEKVCEPMRTTPLDSEYIEAFEMAINALEQEPCIQEKQANADKIDAVYIDGFKAGYSQARFDLEQEPSGDVISRQAVLELIADYDLSMGQVVKGIHALPSVTPQEPKMGHWIVGSDTDIKGETIYWFTCSNCNSDRGQHTNYCPDCGAKMKNTCEKVRNKE